jgi:hypothetical protein
MLPSVAVKKFVFFHTEQSDVIFIKFQTFHVAVVKRVFYSASVWKCTYIYVQAPFWSAVVAGSTGICSNTSLPTPTNKSQKSNKKSTFLSGDHKNRGPL